MFAIKQFDTAIETVREPDWQDLARCNDGTGSMTELFFSEQLDDIAAAKAFCQECPVKEPCLEGAAERREPWGVWGGELFVNGKIVAQKRKRGRPPKVRPEAEAPQAQSA
jgi:WhiB family redox-sensing transcriptional regulator